jgi:hypothetical protein
MTTKQREGVKMNVLLPERFKEGDYLEFERADGVKFRGFVQLKGGDYCKVIFVHFSDGKNKDRIGKQIRLYYRETISYDGMTINKIKKLKNLIADEDLHALMDIAVSTNDKDWFEELGERRREKMGRK